MAKDAVGAPIEVGDFVVVRCEIVNIHETENHPELELQTEVPMFPSEQYGTRLLLRGCQVTKVDEEATPPANAEDAPQPKAKKRA